MTGLAVGVDVTRPMRPLARRFTVGSRGGAPAVAVALGSVGASVGVGGLVVTVTGGGSVGVSPQATTTAAKAVPARSCPRAPH